MTWKQFNPFRFCFLRFDRWAWSDALSRSRYSSIRRHNPLCTLPRMPRNREVFQSGWWEQAQFWPCGNAQGCSLISFQDILSLDWDGFLECTDQHSANNSRGTRCSSPECSCVTASSPVPCPTKCSCLGAPLIPIVPSQLRESAVLCPSSPVETMVYKQS